MRSTSPTVVARRSGPNSSARTDGRCRRCSGHVKDDPTSTRVQVKPVSSPVAAAGRRSADCVCSARRRGLCVAAMASARWGGRQVGRRCSAPAPRPLCGSERLCEVGFGRGGAGPTAVAGWARELRRRRHAAPPSRPPSARPPSAPPRPRPGVRAAGGPADRRRAARRGRGSCATGPRTCSPRTAPTSRPPRRAAWPGACSTGSASPPSASPTWPPSSTSSPPPPSRRCSVFVRDAADGGAGVRAPRARRRDRRGVRGPAERHDRRGVPGAQGPQRGRAAHGRGRAGQRDRPWSSMVIAPALAANGVPAEAVQLVPTPGHAGADALVGLPDLVPARGRARQRRGHPPARRARRRRGHPRARPRRRRRRALPRRAARTRRTSPGMVTDSTDRLGVCNRLNLLLIDRPALRPAVARRRGARCARAASTPEPAAARPPARPRVGAGRRRRGARDRRARSTARSTPR